MNAIQSYFLPYQYSWIIDSSPLRIFEKARQTGLTHTDAYDSVIKATTKHHPLDVWVSSRDEVQAKLYLEDCKFWAQYLHITAADLGEVVLDSKNRFSAYVLEFANG